MTMRIGANVPNSGPLPRAARHRTMAAELEAAGFESLWVSDHIVLPDRDRVALPLRRGRPRDLGDRHAVLRRPHRARADRRRRPSARRSARRCSSCRCATRSSSRSRPRRSTSQAAADSTLGVGAGWLRGGVRRTQRPVRGSRPAARRVDRDRARLLDGHAGRLARPSCYDLPDGRALPADARPRRSRC